ncbi:MAG: hypothetical protein IPK07_02670 [Deltaproteobacteria bacterium]|nr:hypothetical protein [Deltaproteobacteria bacterium]
MIRRIEHEGRLIAIVVPRAHQPEGIEFFTPNDFSQQLAAMARPAGYVIPPHVHKDVPREVVHTLEVLFVRSGRMRVDLYSPERAALGAVELGAGDVILLAAGGHGFTMLEPTEIIEVKQGPYAGVEDKERFEPR